jgi:hypothetical protein
MEGGHALVNRDSFFDGGWDCALGAEGLLAI